MNKTIAKHQEDMTESPDFNGFQRTQAGFQPDPNISIRSPFGRETYDFYRPNEAVPRIVTQDDYRRVMILCKCGYERVGVVRSVIDMMSEFAAAGLEIIHEDEGPNIFYKAWQKKVKLPDRGERFVSWVYKAGNIVSRRVIGKIKTTDLKSITNKDNAQIPIQYVFYDPSTIEIIGGYIAGLSTEKAYALRVPINLISNVNSPGLSREKTIEGLPQEIQDALKGNIKGSFALIPIPNDKLFVGHYKKDDSDIWGKSFIYSILSDIFYNDKLKLAKTSALDSFCNVIRIWKMGDHKEKLYPSPGQAAKLNNILQNNTGAMDIIWDSMLELDEHYPPIDKLVNFEEDINNILLGLGVPEALVGGSNSTTNLTGNYLGLKNLMTRIETGRRLLVEWLEGEIDIIQKEMGFRKRPVIRFSNQDLHDEVAYNTLLLGLLDRNVISDETVLERVSENPEIEKNRIATENKTKDNGELPEKASPFHNPTMKDQRKHEIKKMKLQNELTMESNTHNASLEKPKINQKAGRPHTSKDKVKRKSKSTGELFFQANKIYDYLDEYFTSKVMEDREVKDYRSLSGEDKTFISKSILALFPCIYEDEMNDEVIEQAFDNIADKDIKRVRETYSHLYEDELKSLANEKLTLEQRKSLAILSYIEIYSEGYDEYDQDI